MEAARRCFGGKVKEKDKGVKKEEGAAVCVGKGKEGMKAVVSEDAPSTATKQKVEAAKQYIEKHYQEQMKNLQQRKERRDNLEKKLADADVTKEEQSNILQYLEKKEREFMRLQRHKIGADDFEPLTMIGKGAFGEDS